MNALSVLSQFSDESNRKQFVEKLKSEVLSGIYEPLDCEIMLKSVEDTIKEIRKDKDVENAKFNHADKWSEKTFEYKGFSITKSSKSTYDYSGCGDEILNDLLTKKAEIEESIKKRQTILQNIDGNDFADTQTGNLLNPPVKTSTPYLMIKKIK